MNPGLALLMYGTLGLALCALRMGQGCRVDDAVFSGLFWPLDLSRRWIELGVRALIGPGWEEGKV